VTARVPPRMMTCHRVYWIAIDSGYAAVADHKDAIIIAQALRALCIPFRTEMTDEWVDRALTFSESMAYIRGVEYGEVKGKAKATGSRPRRGKR
jgi:hypothetical protein